jgi:hypothetical protein
MMRLTWKEGATSKAHNMQVEASRNCFQVWLWSFLCCVGRHGWGQGGGLVKSGGVANPCTVQERLGCGLCPQGARHGMEESATVHGSVNSISKADRRAAVCALLVCSWVGFRWVGGCLCRWVGGLDIGGRVRFRCMSWPCAAGGTGKRCGHVACALC